MDKNFLKNSSEEIYKCSKCGQCQSVCPTYSATKNEMFLPRGRYIVLNNFLNNGKKLTKNFIKNLDVCLNCNLCKTFCPTDIDYTYISTLIKSKYNFFNFSKKYKRILYFHKILGNLYRILPFKFLLKNTYSDNLYGIKVKRNETKTNQNGEKAVYIEGCFNKFINPSDKNAALNIIEKLGFNVSLTSECCGYPLICDGKIEEFKANIRKIMNEIPADTKYIICSCDSCFSTLINSQKYFDEDLSIFTKKLITLENLMRKCDGIVEIKEDTQYFKPLNSTSNMPNINKKGECSGMENFFIYKHKKLKRALKIPKVDGQKVLLTTCQLTKWGLIKQQKNNKNNPKVLSLAEYIETK